jgi:hypothetical protein
VVPIAAAMGIAAAGTYPAVTAVGVPRIIDTASYLPVEIFVVGAVGVVPLVAAVWVGLAIGRLVPVLVTAPALAVAGIGLLLIIPVATGKREWLAFVFSPTYGMSLYADYQTIDNRVSVAQAIWLAALGTAGVVLLMADSSRARVAALLPVVLAAAAAIMVMPRGGDFVAHPVDPVAQEQLCADGTPQMCVSRVHSAVLPEVTPLARQAPGAAGAAAGPADRGARGHHHLPASHGAAAGIRRHLYRCPDRLGRRARRRPGPVERRAQGHVHRLRPPRG